MSDLEIIFAKSDGALHHKKESIQHAERLGVNSGWGLHIKVTIKCGQPYNVQSQTCEYSTWVDKPTKQHSLYKEKTIMLNEHSNTVNKLETGGPRLYMCVSYTPWACLPLKSRLTRLLHCYRRIDGFTAIWKLRCFGMSNESLNRAIVTCNQSVTQN